VPLSYATMESLMLQEYCRNETIVSVRGTVDLFSSGCHGQCTSDDGNCSTPMNCRRCSRARKFCQGGCCFSIFWLIFSCTSIVICMSWSKFVNTHLYHSRQRFNLHWLHSSTL